VGVKGLCLERPPWSGESSRPDSRDPVASRVKCGPHGGKKSKTKSARGVCGGSPENCRVTWLSHKTKTGGSAGGDGIRAH
jgi:hypothetical protein